MPSLPVSGAAPDGEPCRHGTDAADADDEPAPGGAIFPEAAIRAQPGAPERRYPDATDPGDPPYNVGLEKGLEVLQLFGAVHRSLSSAQVAALTGMPRGSAQRALHTLECLGYIVRHPHTRRFRMTPKVMELGSRYAEADTLYAAATPHLHALAEITGESASLSEPVGTYMVIAMQVRTTRTIPVLTAVGMRVPMYCSSPGRAYLSTLPDEEVLAVLEASARPQRTPMTRVTPSAIMSEVRACRKRGFACNNEEMYLGDIGIAAAVRDACGIARCAVHVSPPTSRWTADHACEKLGPLVVQTAIAIARELTAG